MKNITTIVLQMVVKAHNNSLTASYYREIWKMLKQIHVVHRNLQQWEFKDFVIVKKKNNKKQVTNSEEHLPYC